MLKLLLINILIYWFENKLSGILSIMVYVFLKVKKNLIFFFIR